MTTTMDPKMAGILLALVGELRRIHDGGKPDKTVLDRLEQDLAPLATQTHVVLYYGGWRDLPKTSDPWGPHTTKILIVKAIRTHCGVPLREAVDAVNAAVPTIPARLHCRSHDVAVMLLREIRGLGGNADLAADGDTQRGLSKGSGE